jgi:hypothetical protein
MSTITYTISGNFGNNPANLQESQLMTQILASNISSACTNVSRDGDNVNISFVGNLAGSDNTTLDGIIASFVATPLPLISPAYIDPSTQLVTHTINNIPYKFVGNQTNEVIISKSTQGQYSSIYAAIAANNNPNTIYAVYPGTYAENHPITLPAGCFLKGMGTAQNTIVVSLNPTQPIIILGAGACVVDITLYGANQVGGKGMYLDCTQSGGQGQFSAIIRCFFIDCNIGVEADNKNASTPSDVMFLNQCVFRTKMAAMDKAVYVFLWFQMLLLMVFL